MNQTTARRRKYFLLHLGRLPSLEFSQVKGIVKASMLIAFILRLDGANGFLSSAKTSICNSLRPTLLRSISISSATTISMTSSIQSKSMMPKKSGFSSLLFMSKSTSSSCIEASRGGNFNSMYFSIPTREMMEEVGALIAILAKPTDVLFLDGDLGAGKTTFSRGFIKCKLGIFDDDCEEPGDAGVEQASLRITSPTYLLSNTYKYNAGDDSSERALKEIHHMDLYRLSGNSTRDFDPLDLRHVFSNCISLIEWPSRLQDFPELLPPADTLLKIDIRIPDPTSDERVMSLVSPSESTWAMRLNSLITDGMVDDLLFDDDGPFNISEDDRPDGGKR